jgi:hypothetical protein
LGLPASVFNRTDFRRVAAGEEVETLALLVLLATIRIGHWSVNPDPMTPNALRATKAKDNRNKKRQRRQRAR